MRTRRIGPAKRITDAGWDKVLTADEQRRVWDYLQGRKPSAVTGKYIRSESVGVKRIVLMFDILLNTGLRAAELVRLRVEDTPIVLDAKAISVFFGKGNRGRTIPICESLAAHIEQYVRNTRPKTMPRHILRSDFSQPLFYNQEQQPYSRTVIEVKTRKDEAGKAKLVAVKRVRATDAFSKLVQRAGEAAGMTKRVFPHMLRHTFAMNAIMNDIKIHQLQALMGHGHVETTMRYLQFIEYKGLGEMLNFTPRAEGIKGVVA